MKVLCEICKRKEATFFIKEQVFGETKTHSLCEDCAKKHKETLMPSNIQIEKLIKSLLDFTEEENEAPKKKVIKKSIDFLINNISPISFIIVYRYKKHP